MMNLNETTPDMLDSADISLDFGKENGIKMQLEERLKKTAFGGYTKLSVEQYAMDVTESMSQMRENFEKQIRTLSAESAKLNNECDVLRHQIQLAEAENEKSKADVRSISKEKLELETRVHKLQAAETLTDEYQRQIREFQQEIQIKVAQIAEYEEQTALLRTKLEDASAKIEMLNEQIADARAQAELVQDKRGAEQLETAYAELEDAKRKNADLTQENEQLHQMADLSERLKKELETANLLLSEQKEENARLSSELAALQQEHAEKLNMASENTESAQNQAADVEKRFSQLYDQYTASLGRIEQLKAEKKAIEQLLKKYQAKEQESNVLKDENTELKTAAAELQNICEELLAEMSRQLSNYQQTSAALVEKSAAIGALNKQKIELQMRNVQIMEQMEALVKNQPGLSDGAVINQRTFDDESSESGMIQELPPRLYRPIGVDMEHAKELLAHAKEISDSYTA